MIRAVIGQDYKISGLTGANDGQLSSAKQSRIVTTLRPRNLHLLRGRTIRALPNLPVHLLSKQIPTIRSATSNNDDLRIDQSDQVRKPDSQVHPETFEDRQRELVTIAPGLINLLSGQFITLQSCLRKQRQVFPRHPHD